MTDLAHEELSGAQILGWAEFACWTGLILMPFLQRVNGPAVSIDQTVVRTSLVVITLTSAIVLRIVNWLGKRTATGREERENCSPEETEGL